MQVVDRDLASLRKLIEGAYDLEEWHLPEGVMKPPRVAGRFMVSNGAVTSIMHDRVNSALQTSLFMYGSYTLTAKEFAYRYDEPMKVTTRDADVSVSQVPDWNDLRVFAVNFEGDAVHLEAKSGQEFRFSPRGLHYSDAGRLLRVWRRLTC
jgi:hypothetical protein